MILTWSEGVGDDNMAEAILVDLGEAVRRHPWWRARVDFTLALLGRLGVCPPARVLDVGCGWGITLEALEQRGYRADGMDISRSALERLDRPGRTLIEADLAHPLPEDVVGYDTVLALDVIEHIDDDCAAVAKLRHLAANGGVVVVSVPAWPDLYGEFDEVQGHRRRYLPESLRQAFDGSGLQVDRILWWGAWAVPLLKRQRARRRGGHVQSPEATYASYLKLPPWPAPWLLRAAYTAEQNRALRGSLKTGTSLFAVARRVP